MSYYVDEETQSNVGAARSGIVKSECSQCIGLQECNDHQTFGGNKQPSTSTEQDHNHFSFGGNKQTFSKVTGVQQQPDSFRWQQSAKYFYKFAGVQRHW